MGHTTAMVLSLIVMIGLIVGLDVAFLRDHFVLRLLTNIAVVAVFAALYFSVIKHL